MIEMDYRLRKFRIDDAESLSRYANNFNVSRYLTDAFPYPYTIEDAREFILKLANDPGLTIFAIEVNNEASGAIGVHPQSDIHRKNAELGYWLAEPYWGYGIVTRAVQEIVEIAFEKHNINRIFARPFSNNPASQRVLEKAGFNLEGRFSRTLIKNNEYLDELIYGKCRNQVVLTIK
jgi:RimJ/RimL family protein N-acetyltransferase